MYVLLETTLFIIKCKMLFLKNYVFPTCLTVFMANTTPDPIFTSFLYIMLTKLGLVKKKKFSYPRAAAQAERREREETASRLLSPATDTNARTRARVACAKPVGVPPEGDEPTGHEDESQ